MFADSEEKQRHLKSLPHDYLLVYHLTATAAEQSEVPVIQEYSSESVRVKENTDHHYLGKR